MIVAVTDAPAAKDRLCMGEIAAAPTRPALSTTAANRFTSGHFLDLVIRSAGRAPTNTPASAADDQSSAAMRAHPGDSKVSTIVLTRAGELIAKSTKIPVRMTTGTAQSALATTPSTTLAAGVTGEPLEPSFDQVISAVSLGTMKGPLRVVDRSWDAVAHRTSPGWRP